MTFGPDYVRAWHSLVGRMGQLHRPGLASPDKCIGAVLPEGIALLPHSYFGLLEVWGHPPAQAHEWVRRGLVLEVDVEIDGLPMRLFLFPSEYARRALAETKRAA